MASSVVNEEMWKWELGKRDNDPAAIGTDESKPKKQKIDEVDDDYVESDTDEDYDSETLHFIEKDMDSSDDDYDSKEQREAVRKYKEQIKNSQGFDVDPYVGPPSLGLGPLTFGLTVLDLEDDNLWTQCCPKAVRFAIRKENEKRKEGENLLEFVKVIKCNYHPVGMFYATFEAKTIPDGEIQVYQTKVFYLTCAEHDESDSFAEVQIFRLKPDASAS